MEKLVYVAWRPAGDGKEDFSARLRGEVAEALVELGARGLQVNVADEAVGPVAIRIVELDPQMEAVVSLWVDTAMDRARRPFEDVLETATSRLEGYLVTESVPLRNTAHPPHAGERTHGFANMAFLRQPPELGHDEWLDIWQNRHTEVANAIQSTFGYVQNVVVRPLTPDAPPFAGIVEELFPPEAMTDLHAFFDCAGDDDELALRMADMNASVERFGANRSIDVVPTSQYVLAPLTPA